jgi:hypothetical protein
MSRGASLLLTVVLLASSLMIVSSSSAQSIPKPSVPEFTLKYADHSHDVPPTTISTFNPYNNKTTDTVQPGYHVQNITIVLTIKNQLFPSNLNGNKTYLFFNVREKGHYGQDWTYLYHDGFDSYPAQSGSEDTAISFPKESSAKFSSGDEIDFQVQAILAYVYMHYLGNTPEQGYDYYSSASEWSNTQTITIPSSQTNSWETWQSELAIGASIMVVLLVSVSLVYWEKRKKRKQSNNASYSKYLNLEP